MAKAKARKRAKASSKSASSNVVLPVADVKSLPDDVLLTSSAMLTGAPISSMLYDESTPKQLANAPSPGLAGRRGSQTSAKHGTGSSTRPAACGTPSHSTAAKPRRPQSQWMAATSRSGCVRGSRRSRTSPFTASAWAALRCCCCALALCKTAPAKDSPIASQHAHR